MKIKILMTLFITITFGSEAANAGVFGKIFSKAIGQAAGRSAVRNTNNTPNIKEQIDKGILEANKQMPQRVDEYTVATQIRHYGSTLAYHYNLNVDKSDFEAFQAELKMNVTKQACSNKMSAVLLNEHSYTIAYVYNQPSGGRLGKFDVHKADCSTVAANF